MRRRLVRLGTSPGGRKGSGLLLVQDRQLHQSVRRNMRRSVIAAVWIAGATVPLLLATVFLVGCCVLPFHGVMHRLMPVCVMAMNAMRGHDDVQSQVPAREKQEPAKRIAVTLDRKSVV